MKKLNEWLMMSLLALLLGTSACSAGGEEEEAPAVPTFPTSQTFNVSANSEQIFSFTANMDWKLSSNKTWCTLASSVMEGQNISGQAGSQSVKIKISDEGQDFTETKATITLSMGGKNQTVAEVIRTAKAYELKVYDAEGNIINTFAITSEGTFEFIVEANFEFGAASVPNWLTIELTVDTNTPSKKNGKITIKEEYFKNPQSATNIVFANELGSASFAIPTTYTGMDSKTIIIKSKDVENGSFWNWNISMDGKTFERNNDLTGTKDEIKEKMTFNVIALNDDYYPIFMEEFEGKYYFEDVNWMHLQKDGETAIFTVDASNKNRNGIALVVPAAVYNEIKNNIEGSILKNDTLKYEYEQKYFLLAFTQKSNTDTSKTGFTVKHGPTWQDIQCTPETVI